MLQIREEMLKLWNLSQKELNGQSHFKDMDLALVLNFSCQLMNCLNIICHASSQGT